MDNFAFMIHPIDPKRDVSRKFPLLGRLLPVPLINYLSRFFPPLYISHIRNVRSENTGAEIEGWFVACPFTPKTMVRLPPEVVYKKVVQTGRLAQKLGARILGLGAFTSVVGDAGLTIARRLDIPVTTGNSYTVQVAVEAVREGARVMGVALEDAVTAVVGATGSIGSVCAQLMASALDAGELILIGRRPDRLQQVKGLALARGGDSVRTATSLDVLPEADLILSATSSVAPVIQPEHLKSGAVVCDVARPRDVSRKVAERRDDVLIIEGGMVQVPGPVDFGFDFGFPPGKAYACMAETMVLAMEGRYEDYTLGKDIELERVEEIARLATKHGFRLAGFRSFERAVTQAEIDQIKMNVQKAYAS